MIVVIQKWQLRVRPEIWSTGTKQARMKGLVIKSLSENIALHGVCGLLFLASIARLVIQGPVKSEVLLGKDVPFQAAMLLVVGYYLLAALGTNAYSTAECGGLHCMIYHHPIPRRDLLVSKIIASLPSVFICLVSLILVFQEIQPTSIFVGGLFVFGCGLDIRLWLINSVNTILITLTWTSGVIHIISIWMFSYEFPWFSWGFEPVHDRWLVAVLPLTSMTVLSAISLWHTATSQDFVSRSQKYRQRYNGLLAIGVYGATCVLMAMLRQVVTL